jgi:hypothetical protein
LSTCKRHHSTCYFTKENCDGFVSDTDNYLLLFPDKKEKVANGMNFISDAGHKQAALLTANAKLESPLCKEDIINFADGKFIKSWASRMRSTVIDA